MCLCGSGCWGFEGKWKEILFEILKQKGLYTISTIIDNILILAGLKCI